MKMVEKMARAIAHANGDDYDAIPAHKQQWAAARGEFGGRFRDVNEPYRADYDEMALAALKALRGEATNSMILAGVAAIHEMSQDGEVAASVCTFNAAIDAAIREAEGN